MPTAVSERFEAGEVAEIAVQDPEFRPYLSW
jgi:hypothetical protein